MNDFLGFGRAGFWGGDAPRRPYMAMLGISMDGFAGFWSGGILDASLRSTQHGSPLSFPRTRGNQKGALRSRWHRASPYHPERSEAGAVREPPLRAVS